MVVSESGDDDTDNDEYKDPSHQEGEIHSPDGDLDDDKQNNVEHNSPRISKEK